MQTSFIQNLASQRRALQKDHSIDLAPVYADILRHCAGGPLAFEVLIEDFYQERYDDMHLKTILLGVSEDEQPQSMDDGCAPIHKHRRHDIKKFRQADTIVRFYKDRKMRVRELAEAKKIRAGIR